MGGMWFIRSALLGGQAAVLSAEITSCLPWGRNQILSEGCYAGSDFRLVTDN